MWLLKKNSESQNMGYACEQKVKPDLLAFSDFNQNQNSKQDHQSEHMWC